MQNQPRLLHGAATRLDDHAKHHETRALTHAHRGTLVVRDRAILEVDSALGVHLQPVAFVPLDHCILQQRLCVFLDAESHEPVLADDTLDKYWRAAPCHDNPPAPVPVDNVGDEHGGGLVHHADPRAQRVCQPVAAKEAFGVLVHDDAAPLAADEVVVLNCRVAPVRHLERRLDVVADRVATEGARRSLLDPEGTLVAVSDDIVGEERCRAVRAHDRTLVRLAHLVARKLTPAVLRDRDREAQVPSEGVIREERCRVPLAEHGCPVAF
mmetsp:Transcript_55925/g.127924  ORF Transcript_55925/g.127924 Transcript_55925/m.127924 type:complete len:268 (-) Transcript_55925:828-1631(-)